MPDPAEPLLHLTRVNHHRTGRHTVFGEAWYAPGGACGPRVQRDYQLVILLAGEMTADIAGNPMRTHSPGEIVLLLPGQRIMLEFDARHPAHHTWVAVAPAGVPPLLARALAAAPAALPPSPSLARLMEAALVKNDYASASDRAFADALGLAALHEYLCMAGRRHPLTGAAAVVARAIAHMEQNQRAPLSVPAIARAAGVTPEHLIRCFAAQGHATPARHLWNMRTARAAELLLHTNLTVAAIAGQCGFQTPFHFSRLFKAQFGRAPTAYRAKAWGKPATAHAKAASRKG